VPVIPNVVQLAFFGFPAAVQVLTSIPFNPVSLGTHLGVFARK
jgi:hypothetical protein